MSEFAYMPDMDDPKPVNDFESDWAKDTLDGEVDKPNFNGFKKEFMELRADKLELFSLYGLHVFESYEDFCSRMRIQHGEDWVNVLKK